ncbi:MAG: efflux RND transporter periplasmic adaptor subunit, partial [Planctomycetota bacterium]
DAGSALEADEAFNALKTLEAELRSAEFALEQRVIRAPFDGIAGITTIEPGDYLRAGDPVTTLDDTSSIVVEFAVPQEAAAYVALDQAVTARLTSDAGLGHKGRVSAIDSRIDSASRTLRVEATVDNDDGLLLPGAVFSVSTESEGARAVSVPGLAVQWDRAGAYVWKRGPDGKAMRASVRIVQRTDDIVLVEGDVAPGEAVAADGSDRVRVGSPLPASGARAPAVGSGGGVSAAGR